MAAGFWGAFFGTAGLVLAGSLAAYVRSRRRVALILGLSALVAAAYVLVHLGWLPLAERSTARVQAHTAILAATTLSHMLLSLLGLLRHPGAARRATLALALLALAVIGAGWALPASESLVLSWLATFGLGALLLGVSVGSAINGNRVARVTATGLAVLLVALAGLSWIASQPVVPWPVHAVTALAAMVFLAMMAAAAWARYSYLLELSEVMAHGPSYDPITRMPSHDETGQMVSEVFFHRQAEARPIGVIVLCIANLYALEKLHGRAAFNHALFVCAGRLRRCVPQTVQMGRLGEDGFLLLTRNMSDLRGLGALARQIRDALLRPVALSVSRSAAHLDAPGTTWVADVGLGVLATSTQVRPSQAVGTARAMARTAWSYSSRLAGFDAATEQIAELPPDASAPASA